MRSGVTLSSSDLPLFLAQDKGYFKAESIDIELESVSTATDAMAHLGTNRIQVLEGGVQANYFNALASKYPIIIAGDRASTPLGVSRATARSLMV